MSDLVNAISAVGYPIVSAVAMFWGCKYIMDTNNKHVNTMFEMYERSNTENRTAIESCTKAIESLCDKLDTLK